MMLEFTHLPYGRIKIILLFVAVVLPSITMYQPIAFGDPSQIIEEVLLPENPVGSQDKSPDNESMPSQTGTPTTAAPNAMVSRADDQAEEDLEKSAVNKLTLENAINRALAANRGLADASDAVEGTRLSLASAETEFELKFLLDGEVGTTGASGQDSVDYFGAGITLKKKFSTGTVVSVGPNARKSDDTYQTNIDTGLTQPLLRGLSREFNLSGVYGAEFGDRSARRSLYLTKVNTVLATIGAVYEAIRQRELVRLNEESVTRLQKHAEAAKAKEKIGLAEHIDAYRAVIQQKQAEDNLNNAREAYRDALDNVKVLLALPLYDEIEVEAPLTYSLVRLEEKVAVQTALKNRVELDQAADTIKEARRHSRVAKHNILPNLDVVLNYSFFGTNDSFNESTDLDQDSWGVSLVTSTDLARKAERIAYDQSLITVRGARRNYDLRRDEVAREVKLNLRNLRRSEKGIAIQDEAGKQAQGQLEFAKVKFKRGMADNFDVIDAEIQLRRSQTNLLSAVIDYIVGSHRLRAAIGTLIERPERF